MEHVRGFALKPLLDGARWMPTASPNWVRWRRSRSTTCTGSRWSRHQAEQPAAASRCRGQRAHRADRFRPVAACARCPTCWPNSSTCRDGHRAVHRARAGAGRAAIRAATCSRSASPHRRRSVRSDSPAAGAGSSAGCTGGSAAAARAGPGHAALAAGDPPALLEVDPTRAIAPPRNRVRVAASEQVALTGAPTAATPADGWRPRSAGGSIGMEASTWSRRPSAPRAGHGRHRPQRADLALNRR